ncbi:hypothetical protein [Thiolapillus sp.]|uniref:hypothetical protein n=1 Tax=Thiolapillus sp. TaxID=2017437 RepID=UPI00263AF1C4|nr:hypothetical protein [Thiolapillus sp.]
MTRTAGAQIGCQRPSRFWGLGCPKIYHEVEDTLDSGISVPKQYGIGNAREHALTFQNSSLLFLRN